MMSRRDAEELALTARAIGAQVVRGSVHYTGRGERLDVGDLEIERTLRGLMDEEVLLIVAPVERGPQVRSDSPLSRPSYRGGECPAWKAQREEVKRAVEERLLFDEDFSALLSEG
jgi:hypothetical protein